jgi:deoxyribodipyrimidine photo-lyase
MISSNRKFKLLVKKGETALYLSAFQEFDIKEVFFNKDYEQAIARDHKYCF